MVFLFLIIGLSIGLIILSQKIPLKELPDGKSNKLLVIAALHSFILSLCLGYFIWHELNQTPQSFSDFISGSLAFSFQTKVPENFGLLGAVTAFIICFIGLSILYQLLYNQHKLADQAFRKLSIYGLIPSALMLGQSLRIPDTSHLLLVSGAFVAITVLVAASLYVSLKRKVLLPQDSWEFSSKLFLSVVFVFMSDVGFSILMSRLGFFKFPIGWISAICSSLLIAITCFRMFVGCFSIIKLLTFASAISQVFIPLCGLVLFPPPIISSGGIQTALQLKPTFYVIFGGVIIFTYVDYFSRIWVNRTKVSATVQISPWVLLSILIFLQSGPFNWPSISSDNYHFGEFYLPFWQLRKFGSLPFVDYQPARGLINYIPGFFSWLFADGSFGYIATLSLHVKLLYLLIGFFGIRSLTGDLGAFLAIFSVYLFDGNMAGGVLVAISVLSLVCKVGLTRSPLTALWAWLAFMFGITLFVVAEGALTTLGTLPLFFYLLIRSFKQQRKALVLSLLLLLVASVVLIMTTRIDEMLISLLRYLVEQSSINEIAHGIPWAYPESIFQRVTAGYLWQFIRFSWLFLLLPVLYELISVKRIVFQNVETTINYLWYLAVFIIIILVIPRANGRIDIDYLSRPGLVSIGLVMSALPFILFKGRLGSARINTAILVVSLIFGALGNQEAQVKAAWSVRKAALYAPIEVISAESTGLSGIGSAVLISDEQIVRQLSIKKVLDQMLAPTETYFNATNNSADYGLQGRRCPVTDCAPYNAPSMDQQERMIQQLEKQGIWLVLLSSESINHDGGPISLRNYWLYKYLLQNYIPFADTAGNIWMIKEGEEEKLVGTESMIDYKGTLDLLMAAFWDGQLAGLPKSWGISYQSLILKLKNPVNLLTVPFEVYGLDLIGDNEFNKVERDACVTMEVPSNPSGDILYIETDRELVGSSMKVFWKNNLVPSFNDLNSFSFDSGTNQYLVPLSSAPSWALGESGRYLRICLPQEMAGEVLFQRIILYDRQLSK